MHGTITSRFVPKLPARARQVCQGTPMDAPKDLPPFTIQTAIVEGWQVVSLIGDLDARTAPDVDLAISQCLTEDAGVILDLRECPFLDSTGVTTLVMAHKHAREAGTIFAVVTVQPRVLRVLEMTGLDVVIPLYESLDSAVA